MKKTYNVTESLSEMGERVMKKTAEDETKRWIVLAGFLLVVGFGVFFMYSSFWSAGTNFITGNNASQTSVEQLPENSVTNTDRLDTTPGKNYQHNGMSFTVLSENPETDSALVVNEKGDVWVIQGGKIDKSTFISDLQCDLTSFQFARVMPEEILSRCTKKAYSNSELFKRDMPELAADGSTRCANGQRLWVDITGGVMTYRCAD